LVFEREGTKGETPVSPEEEDPRLRLPGVFDLDLRLPSFERLRDAALRPSRPRFLSRYGFALPPLGSWPHKGDATIRAVSRSVK